MSRVIERSRGPPRVDLVTRRRAVCFIRTNVEHDVPDRIVPPENYLFQGGMSFDNE